jgi:hypothetical protein
MNRRQISPNGPHDGDRSLLVAILNRLGIVVIIVAGVLISPAGLPEFSSRTTALESTAADLSEDPTWSRTERISRPTTPTPLGELKVMESALPVNGTEIRNDAAKGDVFKLQATADAGTTVTRDSTFKQVCRKLGSRLRKLVGGFVLARGLAPDRDQRIPASFIPSRS